MTIDIIIYLVLLIHMLVGETLSELSIVIPCYNEENRIHLLKNGLEEFAQNWTVDTEVILVNDGSVDNTSNRLLDLKRKFDNENFSVLIIDIPQNQGKGNALKEGVVAAQKEWVLTCDADMATNPLEIIKWAEIVGSFSLDSVYIGSRVHEDSDIQAKWYRKLIGAVYNRITRIFTPVKEGDTQCGFKLYPSKKAKRAFLRLKTLGWAHDIEVLSRCMLDGCKIISLPVHWEHQEGAKINVFLDGLSMLLQTIKIGIILKVEKE